MFFFRLLCAWTQFFATIWEKIKKLEVCKFFFFLLGLRWTFAAWTERMQVIREKLVFLWNENSHFISDGHDSSRKWDLDWNLIISLHSPTLISFPMFIWHKNVAIPWHFFSFYFWLSLKSSSFAFATPMRAEVFNEHKKNHNALHFFN